MFPLSSHRALAFYTSMHSHFNSPVAKCSDLALFLLRYPPQFYHSALLPPSPILKIFSTFLHFCCNISTQPWILRITILIVQADRRRCRLPCLTRRLQLTLRLIAPLPACTSNRNFAHTMTPRARSPSPKDLLRLPKVRTSP